MTLKFLTDKIAMMLLNVFQAFFFATVWPFSKKTYIRINKVIVELLWLEFVWLADWWAGLKVPDMIIYYTDFLPRKLTTTF